MTCNRLSRHEFDTAMPVSEAVLMAMADEHDTDPSDLPALYTEVDPDALDGLFLNREDDSSAAFREIGFTYYEHRIRVHPEGTIQIAPLGE